MLLFLGKDVLSNIFCSSVFLPLAFSISVVSPALPALVIAGLMRVKDDSSTLLVRSFSSVPYL
jgi:hypothetical protein